MEGEITNNSIKKKKKYRLVITLSPDQVGNKIEKLTAD